VERAAANAEFLAASVTLPFNVAERTSRLQNLWIAGYLSEIHEKLRVKFGFLPRHAHLMALFVAQQIELVEVTSVVKVCGDPDDDHILAAALDADCSLLVTGDADLLALKKFQGIDIVTPRQFSESIRTK
jgi:putative PIN family toxin of toxin-antitoxin system